MEKKYYDELISSLEDAVAFANGGALSNGNGSIFLWLFCALAFLKTAQRFDSYLASLGLNVAQTGSSMGMEMLMAARVLSGVASSSKTAGNTDSYTTQRQRKNADVFSFS